MRSIEEISKDIYNGLAGTLAAEELEAFYKAKGKKIATRYGIAESKKQDDADAADDKESTK